MLQSPTTIITLCVAPSLSPPMVGRFSFHCGARNLERSSQHLASDPFFLDRLMENNQPTIHLAWAQRAAGTHPGHLDLHPGLRR